MKKLDKFYGKALKLVPICASHMMLTTVNSTSSWFRGQEKMPEGAKRYRKF